MLILVRKVSEGIWIEGDIWVKVLSVERDRVKLGIEAPSSVKVMRQELFTEAGHAGKGADEDPAPAAPEARKNSG